MRKPVYAICEQQRHRSACASGQSDQRLSCSLPRQYNISNVLFLMSDNEFSGIIYSLFGGSQNIFLTIFSTKFVVKCATKILKIGSQKQKLCQKIFLNKEFSIEK